MKTCAFTLFCILLHFCFYDNTYIYVTKFSVFSVTILIVE